MHHASMSFEQASATAEHLWQEVRRLGKDLNAFPKGAMGLTPDSVKASPEYQAATAAYQAAHQQLCTFNVWYTKTFRAQIRSARQAHSKACPTPS